MQTPPLHNFISSIGNTYLFLNIFTKGTPYYFSLSDNNSSIQIYTPSCIFEELYQYVKEEEDHKYLIPTSATTPEEARLLHPELFI